MKNIAAAILVVCAGALGQTQERANPNLRGQIVEVKSSLYLTKSR